MMSQILALGFEDAFLWEEDITMKLGLNNGFLFQSLCICKRVFFFQNELHFFLNIL